MFLILNFVAEYVNACLPHAQEALRGLEKHDSRMLHDEVTALRRRQAELLGALRLRLAALRGIPPAS